MSEYALVAGLVAVVAIGAVVATGDKTKDVFCEAANGLASAAGLQTVTSCSTTPITGLPELAPSERYVEAPVQIVADFQDLQFPNPETGERVVLASLPESTPLPLWFDAEILSRQAYEAPRAISSCYLRGGVSLPICTQAASATSIEVPKGATAFGYQVDLPENTIMPWSNDVSLSTQGSAEVTGQEWTVVVSRADAPPVRDASYVFENQVYETTDVGERYIPFADLEGQYNVPLWFHVGMRKESAVQMYRKPCYKMHPEDDPTCGTAYNTVTNTVEVPVGASEVGFSYVLPAMELGADWVATFPTSLHVGQADTSQEIHSQDVVITRQNEPIIRDVSFDMPATHTFEQTDTGLTYVPFANLQGKFNVPVWFHVGRQKEDVANLLRQPCYKLSLEATPVCATSYTNAINKVEVPVGAVQIGFSVQLPGTTIGSDWVKTFPVSLRETQVETSAVIDSQDVVVIRPNEPITRDVSFTIPDHTFAYDVDNFQYLPFADIEGDFNVPIWIHVSRQHENSVNLMRTACYKLTPESNPSCDTSYTNTANKTQVPVGATQVGIGISLPSGEVATDWVRTVSVSLRTTSSATSELLHGADVKITKAAAPAAE